MSRLYVVLDHGGGWRFVITRPRQIKHHLGKKGEGRQEEIAIEVPKVRIAEPVEWDDLPRTITLAERYANKWMIARGYNNIPVFHPEVFE